MAESDSFKLFKLLLLFFFLLLHLLSKARKFSLVERDIFQLLQLLHPAKDGHKQKIQDAISTLLQKRPDIAKQKDEYGMMPLHKAALYHNTPVEIVAALLQAWPDAAKEKDSRLGLTPLHIACWNEAPSEIVAALLQAWPDSSKQRDKHGNTPLQVACCVEAPVEVVILLLNNWLSYKENTTNSAIMSLQIHASRCTGDSKEIFSQLFALCNSNALTRPPREIMDYFIRNQLWNGVTLVLDRHPTLMSPVTETMGLDTKVMADFLSTVGRCCSLTTMWEVLRNEQDLLEGV